MQKQQSLVGILIFIILAIGIAISSGRNTDVDSTGRTDSIQAPSTIETARSRTSSEPRASTRPRASSSQAARTDKQQTDGFATIAFDDLPREAKQTIDLIQQGGPFPYNKDGSVFGNRERLLPSRPSGYYREYTVETPGSDDRGARRIVAGEDGELYYTDDHYDSFRRVR
jgi:guanyl-specific ribonuclease Sa